MPDPVRKTLSSTEIPQVLGKSPYGTRWIVMQRFLGNELPDPTHNYMDWGLLLQPKVLERAAAELALEIEQNTLNIYTRRNSMGFTADGWTRAPDKGRGIVECKCVFNPRVWMTDWAGGKRVPEHVQIQHQVQLYCGDGEQPFTWGVIVAWFQAELFFFDGDPKPELWPVMEHEAEQFFADLEAKNYGSPFGHPREIPLINQLFAPTPGKVLDWRDDTPEHRALAQDAASLVTFAEDRKFAAKNEDALKGRLRAAVTDAEKLLLPHGVVIDAKRISKKAHQVKASSYTQLDIHVPDAIPFDDVQQGGISA